MSRSYKESKRTMCSSKGDKYCRTYFHRSDRRKVRQQLKQVSYEKESFPIMDCELCLEFYFEDYNFYIPYSDYMDKGYCPDFNKCYYHRCYEIGNFIEDKILNSDYDRSLKFSSRWSWASDGGAYWSHDLSSTRKDFDKEVFGISPRNQKNIWEMYLQNRDTYRVNPYTRKWKVELIYETDTIYRDYFKGEWVKETYSKFLEVPYHKGYVEIPDEEKGYITYKVRKKRDWSKRQPHSDWFLMDFLFRRNIVPRNFSMPEELISWLRINQESIIRKWSMLR